MKTLLYSLMIIMIIISCKGDNLGEMDSSQASMSTPGSKSMISSVGRVLTNSGITKRKVIFDDNLSNFFSLQTIEFILNQPDVVGIRAFIASRNNERLVVLVGFNEKLQDIRTAFTSSSMNNAMVQKQTGINTLENNLFAKHISFKLATTFILQYQKNHANALWASLFGKSNVYDVLQQPGTVGIRFFLSSNNQGQQTLQFCGVSAEDTPLDEKIIEGDGDCPPKNPCNPPPTQN